MDIDHCLATYGSLAPGRPNHHRLAGLSGEWTVGTVRGKLVRRGWGAALGYPALIPAEDGGDVEVHLFVSPELPDHWPALDAFEGVDYRRGRMKVQVGQGWIEAWMYLDSQASDAGSDPCGHEMP